VSTLVCCTHGVEVNGERQFRMMPGFGKFKIIGKVSRDNVGFSSYYLHIRVRGPIC